MFGFIGDAAGAINPFNKGEGKKKGGLLGGAVGFGSPIGALAGAAGGGAIGDKIEQAQNEAEDDEAAWEAEQEAGRLARRDLSERQILQGYDPATQSAIEAQRQRAMKHRNYGQNDSKILEDMAGFEPVGEQEFQQGLLAPAEASRAMGGESAILGQALGDRARQKYDMGASDRAREVRNESYDKEMKALEVASHNAKQDYAFRLGLANKQDAVYKQMNQARSSTVADILGGLGTVIGYGLGSASPTAQPEIGPESAGSTGGGMASGLR